MDEDDLTVKLFKQLDKTSPSTARAVYGIAEPHLIGDKEYRLFGKYVDPREALKHDLEIFQAHIQFAAQRRTAAEKKFETDSGKQMLENRVATLVAILVLNDRRDEGEAVASEAAAKCEALQDSKAIEAALKGSFPDQIY